jgi:hypothetical protein
MWISDERMQAYEALSYRDKLRVGRCVARGEAPREPRLAIAAVELAESYERRSPAFSAFIRWWPLFLIVPNVYLAIANWADGDRLGSMLYMLIVLGAVWSYMFDPGLRPGNTARLFSDAAGVELTPVSSRTTPHVTHLVYGRRSE